MLSIAVKLDHNWYHVTAGKCQCNNSCLWWYKLTCISSTWCVLMSYDWLFNILYGLLLFYCYLSIIHASSRLHYASIAMLP